MLFEVLLDNDLGRAEKARIAIENATSSNTENYSNTGNYSEFGHVVEITANVEAGDVWNVQNDLMKIDGVVDVDPELENEDEEERYQAQYFLESKLYSSAGVSRPAADWYHHAIRFDEAKEYAKYAFHNLNGHFDGSQRIKVAQLDTGYTDHPEVKNYLKSEGHNFIKSEASGHPYDRLRSTRPFPIRWGGHGTSCAGVMIGGFSNLNPQDPDPDEDIFIDDLVDGLFPNVDLIPYRISRNIISFNSKMAKAIDMIINRGDISVISISHATLVPRRTHHLAIKEAANRGILVIAAPGSHISGFKKIFTYPAKFRETIAPAASTVQGMPWDKTHGGAEVDLCAPGYEIYIPFPYRKGGREYYGYKWSEGSSFSVPITACAASLWLLHHGDERLRQTYGARLPGMFRKALHNTLSPFSGQVKPGLYGQGILNVSNLVRYPLDPPRSGTGSAKRYVAALSRKMDQRMEAYVNEKELMHHALMAKIHTDDRGEELSEYIMDNCRNSLKAYVGKRFKSEHLKHCVKRHAEYWYH